MAARAARRSAAKREPLAAARPTSDRGRCCELVPTLLRNGSNGTNLRHFLGPTCTSRSASFPARQLLRQIARRVARWNIRLRGARSKSQNGIAPVHVERGPARRSRRHFFVRRMVLLPRVSGAPRSTHNIADPRGHDRPPLRGLGARGRCRLGRHPFFDEDFAFFTARRERRPPRRDRRSRERRSGSK